MPTHEKKFLNFLFDLRAIIAVLFAIYGIVCIVWGLGFTPSDQLAKADGFNINLWAGVGMLVVAALFVLWTVLKPLGSEATAHSLEESEAAASAAEHR
jgi:drug/metabolite transporter (DMT)-like permease